MLSHLEELQERGAIDVIDVRWGESDAALKRFTARPEIACDAES